jgi:hypothetical protein
MLDLHELDKTLLVFLRLQTEVCSHNAAMLSWHRVEMEVHSSHVSGALSDTRLSFGGLAGDPFQPSCSSSFAAHQAYLHRTTARRDLSADFRQLVSTTAVQPAMQEGGTTTEVPDSEEDR